MPSLSQDARHVLDRMEPHRRYEPPDLRALVPDASVEYLRELMHELWVNRHVERVGYHGWRRHESAPAHQAAADTQADAGASDSGSRQTKAVKPEDLFDHAGFAGFFK